MAAAASSSGFSSSSVGGGFKKKAIGKKKEEEIIEEEIIEEEILEEAEEAEEQQVASEAAEASKASEENSEEAEEEEKPAKKAVKGKALKKKKKEEESEEPEESDDPNDPEEDKVDKKAAKKAKKKKKATLSKKKQGLAATLEKINNIGMGKEASLFIQGMATMLDAGVPLLDALRIYHLEVRARAMKKVMVRMTESVEQGMPFWQAMEDLNLFTQYDIAMVRIGEEAGNLARNIQYLAEQKEKDRSLKQKVKMAMVYPTIVMVMMFIIVMGLGMFVLPNLVQVLFSLNVELPATTRMVIAMSNFFSEHGAVAAPSMIAGMVVFALLSKYTRFKVVSQWMLFRIPGIGSLAKYATIARFGVILGGLLRAGVPLMEAVASLVNVTQVVAYKNFYQKLHDRLLLGDSFSKIFKEVKGSQKILPISVQSLVVTGEKSGSLSKSLVKIAEIYEKKATETADALPTILEPVLLLFVGGLVGTIAFAIIVPIYSVVGNVGG